jgi:RNA polymerase sigma factor (sigma-70 family)
MKRDIEFKSFRPDDRVTKLIDRLTSKLEKNAAAFSPKLAHLRLMLEENSVRTLYNVSITLDVPGKTLAAKEEQHDIQAGIRAGFAEIERQLKKYKASVHHEHWKRPERREEIREIKAEAASTVAAENKRDVFLSLITPHLKRLYHFVHHVIAYSEAVGDLVRSDLTPEDVVDGALVRANREFLTGRSIPNVKNWLIRLAMDQLDAEVIRLKAERANTVHIEEDVPETPPAQEVSTLGEEILDFYQPDEDLKLEDLIPDSEVPTPEDEVLAKELRRSVNRALNEMPREWRQTLLLHDIEGRSPDEIAKKIGKADSEIGRILQSAHQYLRQRLIDAGFHFKRGEERAA